jgi:hypothetical protein
MFQCYRSSCPIHKPTLRAERQSCAPFHAPVCAECEAARTTSPESIPLPHLFFSILLPWVRKGSATISPSFSCTSPSTLYIPTIVGSWTTLGAGFAYFEDHLPAFNRYIRLHIGTVKERNLSSYYTSTSYSPRTSARFSASAQSRPWEKEDRKLYSQINEILREVIDDPDLKGDWKG